MGSVGSNHQDDFCLGHQEHWANNSSQEQELHMLGDYLSCVISLVPETLVSISTHDKDIKY